MFYFKIGLRNIIKNLRKTSLTMATLVFGMASLVVYSGSNTYLFRVFREGIIHSQYGHFQIYRSGYIKNGKDYPFDYLIDNYKEVIEEIKKIPEVKFIAPRLSFSGLISGDKMSTVIMGIAGSPDEETIMNSSKKITGEFIKNNDPSAIVAGDGLLKKLSGSPGDNYTIMSTMKGGGLNGINAVVKGVRKGYGESDQMSKMYVLANLQSVQTLLNLSNSVDTLIVMLEKTEDISRVEPEIKSICNKLGLEYKKWNDLAVYYKSVKGMFDMNMFVLSLIILAILIFIIANTMSMNLMERIREIGTIRALGTTRIQVAGIFLAESFLIGIIGSAAGITLGYIIAAVINIKGGIYNPPSVFQPDGFTTYIKPEFSVILVYLFFFIVVAVFSAVFTARKAAKMDIADALRWI